MKKLGLIIVSVLAGVCGYIFNEQYKIRKHGTKALQRSVEMRQNSEDLFGSEESFINIDL